VWAWCSESLSAIGLRSLDELVDDLWQGCHFVDCSFLPEDYQRRMQGTPFNATFHDGGHLISDIGLLRVSRNLESGEDAVIQPHILQSPPVHLVHFKENSRHMQIAQAVCYSHIHLTCPSVTRAERSDPKLTDFSCCGDASGSGLAKKGP